MKKSGSILFFFFAALLLSFTVNAQNWEVGKTYRDEKNRTEFTVGNIPLIISVPHGGSFMPVDIPDRNCPDVVNAFDIKTIELAREIETTFIKKYGLRPFIVICNISRKKIDQNREIEVATCGNEEMKKVWNNYHNYLDTAVVLATKQFGTCTFIDLHGHGHVKQRIEIGYLLKAEDLDPLSIENEAFYLKSKSSLNNLPLKGNTTISFKELMTGENAFGTLMANQGIASIPSKQDPFPVGDDKYFNGGYNTKRYTSLNYPKISGWQIETNYKGVRDEAGRPLFAKAFVNTMSQWLNWYHNFAFPEPIISN